jgi:uncharacterized membrane protein YhaH (DUF805 family)
MRLTNAGEIGAFFLARAIVVAVLMVGSPFLLSPIYMQLFRTGGIALMTVATLSVSVVAWLITFLLFLVFRGGFGAVPGMVAGQGRRDVMTTSGGEIGAYVIAVLVVMVAFYAFNSFVLSAVYASLRQSGQMYLVLPLSIATAVVTAVVFFVLFVAVRGAMPAVPSDGAPIESYQDSGGASMGFGQAIATCFRKYAVFSGRASRSEYWFFVLFEILLYIVLVAVDIAAFRGSMNVFSTLASLVLLLPGLAVQVRRLHDTDKSGWWVLISLVPIIGWIWLIVLLCTPGTAGANRFGMGPAEAAIPEVFA